MRIKRILIAALLLSMAFSSIVAPLAALASDVSGALYYGIIRVSNNSTATTDVATTCNISTQNLIDGDYLNATANNCALQSATGADIPFMPGIDTYPWSIFVESIGANAYFNDLLYLAESTGGDINWFPGIVGGNTTDAASLEPGANFTIEQEVYLNTDEYSTGIGLDFNNTGWAEKAAAVTAPAGDEISIDAVFRYDTAGSDEAIVFCGDPTASWQFWRVYKTSGEKLNFAGGNSTGADDAWNWTSTNSTSADTWYSITVTYNRTLGAGARVAVYVNGHKWGGTDVGTAGGSTIYQPNTYLDIGAYGPGHGYTLTGQIDEVRISDTARTLIEHQTAYNNGECLEFSLDADTISLYHFNEETGATAIDAAGNNDLTETYAYHYYMSPVNACHLIMKDDAFRTYISTSDNVASVIQTSPPVKIEATGLVKDEYIISTSISDREDIDDWAANCQVLVPFGAGVLPAIVIEEQELTGAAASVTFSDIGTKVAKLDTMLGITSRHLVVIVNAASSAVANADDMFCRFNGDSGAFYNYQRLYGAGAGAGADSTASTTRTTLGPIPGSNYANAYGGGILIIPAAFLTSNHKSMLVMSGAVEEYNFAIIGRYASTNAIDSIVLYLNADNLIANSTFQLGVIDERYLVEEDYNAGADFLPVFDGIASGGDMSSNLVCIGYARTDRAFPFDPIQAELNNDGVATNYYMQTVEGAGGATFAQVLNRDDIALGVGDTAGANQFSPFITLWSQYAETVNYKAYLTLSGYHESGGNSDVQALSGEWDNANAITKIEIVPETGAAFKAGSLFSLYRVPAYLIAREELTLSDGTISFANIPQTFEHLQVNIYARSETAALADNVTITFNNDTTAANYDYQFLSGDNTTAVTANRNAASQILMTVPGSTETANLYGGGLANIFEYAKTDRHKHYLSFSGRPSRIVTLQSARWEDADNISRIDLRLTSGANFTATSIIELVGWLPSRPFQIQIDGEVKAQTSANATSVPDTAYDWLSVDNNTAYYMGYQEITVGGVQTQYVDWEYDDTDFTDDSGFGNPLYPSFRTGSSDADVSAELLYFYPTSEAKAPAYALDDVVDFIDAGAITDNLSSGGGNFTITPPSGGFPLAGVVTAVAGATAPVTPAQLPLITMSLVVMILSSFATTYMLRKGGDSSYFVKFGIWIALIGIAVALKEVGWDFWMLVIFANLGITFGFLSRHMSTS